MQVFIYIFILFWSFSTRALTNDTIIIKSSNDQCIPADYERVKLRITHFENYKEIDDEISWSMIWNEWLKAFNPEHPITGIISRLIFRLNTRNIRPLDMKISQETAIPVPKTTEVGTTEVKRSEVSFIFSPMGLDRRYAEIYPRVFLICSISESQGETLTLNHRCEQIPNDNRYAFRSFSSTFQMIEHDCGFKTSFEVLMSLDPQHVNAIYQSIGEYHRLPHIFLRFFLQMSNRDNFFALYFKSFYRQFL